MNLHLQISIIGPVGMDKAAVDRIVDSVEANGLHFFDIVQNAFANPNSQEEAIMAYEVMIGDLEKLERLLVDNQMDHRTLTADADVEKIRGEISELFNEKNKLMDCIRSCSQKLSH